MKVFVSHANKDKELIEKFKKDLEQMGITLLFAEHFYDLAHTISEKIENMINSCDIALILLTENGFKASFVQQEIGYIKRAGKPFIQVVQKGLEEQISGFNFGRDYIELDPSNADVALKKVRGKLLQYWDELRQKELLQITEIQRRQALERKMKEERQKIFEGLAALALVIIIVAVLSKAK